ncbi:Short-chain dehydrogenase [Parasphingorhabdus marina DSM 22363]|uniref:Short-chain dehydrogenase n=1 Tax=Parasphingorhabdus marina DSM 22363 TaxID=1123272 RepID=A0A1N6CZ76_9SPHN|nr:SDR family oxidoreductase [Parasphingorhabdus marina]SIN63766.1 Short-chain dehydrogenase [Parasphingorhabdus marina DSM 22363]
MSTVLITGANRGIGLEMARQYADNGWEVIGTARQADAADELNTIAGAETMELDVADEASVQKLAEALGDRPVDLFINNAGIYGPADFDRSGWLDLFNVNVVAPVELASSLKDNVARSGQKKMVVLSSQVGSIAENDTGSMMYYRSSKAAVNQAWKSLALQWQNDGLTLAMLHPGWVQTDMGGPQAPLSPEESVSGLRQVIDGLAPAQTGHFYNYDGREIPW